MLIINTITHFNALRAKLLPKYMYNIALLVIFFASFMMQSNGQAAENAQCNHFNVAGAQSWYPYSYVKEGQASYSGVLINSLLDTTKQQSVFLNHWTNMPWKRAERSLEQNKIDILLGAFYTPERAKKWYFSKPLASSELVLFSLKEIENVKDLKEVYTKGISYPFGMATGEKFSAIKSKIRTDHIIKHDQIYGRILKKHTDFGLLPKIAVEAYLTEHDLKDKFKIHPVKLDYQNVYLVTAKTNPCLAKIKFVFNNIKRNVLLALKK